MNNRLHLNPWSKTFLLVLLLITGYANDSFAQSKKHESLPIDPNKVIIAKEGSTYTPVFQPKVKFRKNVFELLREKLQETMSKKGEARGREEEKRTCRPDSVAE